MRPSRHVIPDRATSRGRRSCGGVVASYSQVRARQRSRVCTGVLVLKSHLSQYHRGRARWPANRRRRARQVTFRSSPTECEPQPFFCLCTQCRGVSTLATVMGERSKQCSCERKRFGAHTRGSERRHVQTLPKLHSTFCPAIHAQQRRPICEQHKQKMSRKQKQASTACADVQDSPPFGGNGHCV